MNAVEADPKEGVVVGIGIEAAGKVIGLQRIGIGSAQLTDIKMYEFGVDHHGGVAQLGKIGELQTCARIDRFVMARLQAKCHEKQQDGNE